MNYGERLRHIRAEKGITLRQLALESDIDVAYLSRVERGTIPPPQKEELLESICRALGLKPKEARELKDLAATDNRRFPADIAQKTGGLVGIPMLLRTVSNKKLSPDQIREVAEYIRKQY
jgi:transcriptional regulator with XRE-family HTH domain